MARLGRGFPIRPHIAPPAALSSDTETVSQHGVVVFSAPFTAPTFHNAPRVDEVYVEAGTRGAGVAHADQVYVEVATKRRWYGWGLRL